MSKLEIKRLCAQYEDKNGTFLALKDISLQVEQGEFVSVIGSSGCGKSTLLSILQGLNFPSSGSVTIDGKPITGPGTDRGVVFQHYSLFPWMSARNNIAFALKQCKKELSRNERHATADTFLAKVGLSGFGHKYPFQLSGGMQQRVAIARALAMDAEILLMDEPFGAIDAKNRTNMQELLLALWEGDGQAAKKTVVFVTHDIDEAIFLSDRIVMLSNSPGQIAQEFRVPFARPRSFSTLVSTDEYRQLRTALMSLFFQDIIDKIGGEEVVL